MSTQTYSLLKRLKKRAGFLDSSEFIKKTTPKNRLTSTSIRITQSSTKDHLWIHSTIGLDKYHRQKQNDRKRGKYSLWLIKNCKSYGDPSREVSDDSHPSDVSISFASSDLVVIFYVRGVSEKISRMLRNNVGFKLLNVLRARFPRPKDPTLQSRGVVYKIDCLDCDFFYYG